MEQQKRPFAGYEARHFLWQAEGKVATITLNRPEKKNPLTFESYSIFSKALNSKAFAAG